MWVNEYRRDLGRGQISHPSSLTPSLTALSPTQPVSSCYILVPLVISIKAIFFLIGLLLIFVDIANFFVNVMVSHSFSISSAIFMYKVKRNMKNDPPE